MGLPTPGSALSNEQFSKQQTLKNGKANHIKKTNVNIEKITLVP